MIEIPKNTNKINKRHLRVTMRHMLLTVDTGDTLEIPLIYDKDTKKIQIR